MATDGLIGMNSIRPDQPTYRSQGLDHRGLVAGMCDALSLGDMIAQATPQHPARRDLTVGEAVNAMVLNGLGCIHQARYLGPSFCPHQPTDRRISPRVAPDQLNDDALGRAVDTLDDYGVTALSRLIAATAAQRRGLSPLSLPLDRTSVHVDGRYHSDEPPAAHVVHRTTGSRREHRPDLHHVRWAWIVEPHAGSPGLMQPLSGTSRAPHALGQVMHADIDQ
jgi:transposase